MSFLRLDLPEDVYKKVLVHLHDLVIPACFNPLLLSDFLTHSLDKGDLDLSRMSRSVQLLNHWLVKNLRNIVLHLAMSLQHDYFRVYLLFLYVHRMGILNRYIWYMKIYIVSSLPFSPAGGLIGMLALNGIFLLVTEFGLEYPKFYQKLYGLVCIEAFQVGYALLFAMH